MSNRRIWSVLTVAVAMMWTTAAQAQNVALKTNLLYDATTTPNLGIEVQIGKRNTAQIFYGLNPWTYRANQPAHLQKMAKHWCVMPEIRWWQCTPMNGFFWGIHAMGGQFNVSKMRVPQVGYFFGHSHDGDDPTNYDLKYPTHGNIFKAVRDTRVEGNFIGAGATVGYQWILTRHWNLEAEIGAGYDYVWTKHYKCSECNKLLHDGGVNYIGLTKAGISLMYVF